MPLDPSVRTRIDALIDEGSEIYDRFDRTVRAKAFHPFVAADYDVVLRALIAHRVPGRRFLELGSATGVITIVSSDFITMGMSCGQYTIVPM